MHIEHTNTHRTFPTPLASTVNMFNSTCSTHILVCPLAGSGHLIPLLDLTCHLLCRGLTITIVISAANLPLLDPLLSSHPSSLHKLLLPEPVHSPSKHPLIAKVTATRQLFDPIVQWSESHPTPPGAIISDFFLGWTHDLASHLGVRHVVFSPSGALGYSIFDRLWRDALDINALGDGDKSFMLSFPDIPNIPNMPAFPLWQMSQLWRSYKKGEPGFESFIKGVLDNMNSWGVLFNTFEGMEGDYIDYVKKQMGHDRVWAVGPLLPDEHDPKGSTERGGSSVVPSDDLLTWLDQKRDSSVVYICFGSRGMLSEKEMRALTGALTLSKVDFILCVQAGGSSLIPSGFEHEVGGRGFIVKGWAPQLAILKHQAVGSFLTHCGWNSTLEGVTSGVMMLTWPLGADQFTNAALLVDQLGVGVRVRDGGTESVPDSVKLARLLEESLSVDRPERVKVKELSRVAINAVKEGTSVRNLNAFVKLISEI